MTWYTKDAPALYTNEVLSSDSDDSSHSLDTPDEEYLTVDEWMEKMDQLDWKRAQSIRQSIDELLSRELSGQMKKFDE